MTAVVSNKAVQVISSLLRFLLHQIPADLFVDRVQVVPVSVDHRFQRINLPGEIHHCIPAQSIIDHDYQGIR
jgi:hypothetical protein